MSRIYLRNRLMKFSPALLLALSTSFIPAEKPNVGYIICDDLGSCSFSPLIAGAGSDLVLGS
jgi:hypothetical protein